MSATSSHGPTPPKSMSSRLLTMKFMQRAAASSPTTSASPDEPSPKRRKTDSNISTPSKINVDSLADRTAVQAALASEEAKRQAALEKQAADAGDTRWVLSFEDQRLLAASSPLGLRIVQAGFANIDSSQSEIRIEEDGLEDKPVMVGRRSFGRFNKALEKQQDPSLEETSESGSEDDDEDNDSSEGSSSEADDPTSDLIKASRREAAERAREERRFKKRAEKAEVEEIARKRRKNDVNLNGLTSLSGRQERPIPPDVKCFNCGGNHFKKDCKERKRGYHGGDDGPPRKARKG
ncbi:hypothetical protein V8E51_016108 [Hyaloscypha variabilis]|uniref:CCHC-type domain-containing protein n=1 Tax=Hyaloscypha variabilis (strain UAMH 11265 / GT02V1 / F) TaxID=1149755 RepID=A0A2J6RQ91_HYAVF|nr:hypothetical protein L207DRAFT_554353 [Hyaloscypha variabilis F]